MSEYILKHPVFTFEKYSLFNSNTMITSDTMETLISEHKKPFQSDSLLQYSDVKKDILSFLEEPPYDVVFGNRKDRSGLFGTMEKVRLPIPVLKSLYYCKSFDFSTYRHILTVFALSTLLSKILVADKNYVIQEVIAFPTHDIGKICVPLEILNKKDPLTSVERDILEHHSLAGYVLLSYYFQDTQNLAARIARDHHERRDGSGYPSGICIDDLLLDIIIVCDVYDALISPRPYRPVSYDNRTAVEEIIGMLKENKIRMEPVQALVAVNRAEKPHYSECILSQEKRGTPPAENVYGLIDNEN